MILLIYIILCLIWGSTWLAIKIGLQDSPPLWSAGFRFVIASVIIFIINLVRRVDYPKSIREIMKIIIPGIFMYAASYMLVYSAEVRISSSLTAVLFSTFPFLVAGFSYFMLKAERLRSWGWLGLIIGFCGILAVFYQSLIESKFILLGTTLAVLGAAVSAFGTVYIRAYMKKYDISIMAAIQMAIGAIIIIISAAFFEPISAFKFTFKSVAALLYLSIIGTVVAFLGYYWLLKRAKAITVSQIAIVTPLIAVVLGFLFLSETFSPYSAIGAGLILTGVLIVIRR